MLDEQNVVKLFWKLVEYLKFGSHKKEKRDNNNLVILSHFLNWYIKNWLVYEETKKIFG